jgi:tRNA A-37 threonylcarbamoyl transferase component Bud32
MKRRAEPSGSPSPTVIEGFSDLVRIGSGGFSVVFRGREQAMSRDVAIKVLNSGMTTESERRTFERECRALGQLSGHPNIVTVYRPAFTADARPCIVMELYHGNYRERLDRVGPLPVDELLTVGVRVAGALHTAHRAGVLHRDLKPHNIFLSTYGEPALGDFGISTIDDERSHSGASGLSVAYAAPEVLEDSDASVASDVYSLAATLYHLAAGTAPFASGDLRTAVRRILTDPPPPLPRADVPPGLDRALRSAMAKDPADRPATALAFAEMLREVQARAGLTPTTIPSATTAAGAFGSVAGPTPSGLAPPAAGAAAPPGLAPPRPGGPTMARLPAVAPADDPSGVTIARRERPQPPPEPEPAGPSARRRWVATGAAVAAVALVGAGIALAGGGDDDTGPTTTDPTVSSPDDTFYATLTPPASVRVTAGAGGTFSVDLQPVEGATAYEIEPVNAAIEQITVAADALPGSVPAAGVANLCVVVRAIGEGGRISRDSAPACAG